MMSLLLFQQFGRRCFIIQQPSLLLVGRRSIVSASSLYTIFESSSTSLFYRWFSKDTKKKKDAAIISTTEKNKKKNDKRHKKSNLNQQKKLLQLQQQKSQKNNNNTIISTKPLGTDTTTPIPKEASKTDNDFSSKPTSSSTKKPAPKGDTTKSPQPQQKQKQQQSRQLELKSPKKKPKTESSKSKKPQSVPITTTVTPSATSATDPQPQEDTPHQPDPQQQQQQQQHLEWVKFQQRISVDGFETGQTTTAIKVGKKLRTTDKMVLSENQRRILERQRLTGTGGGEYPPLRYSDEETERLLSLAYNALPKRTGPRGSRNLKRQERRWQLVRELRAKQKAHGVKAHERRMRARSTKISTVQEILKTAHSTIQQDRQYQLSIYKRWAATMGLT